MYFFKLSVFMQGYYNNYKYFQQKFMKKSIMLIKSTVSLKYKVFISALITGGINLPVNFLVW